MQYEVSSLEEYFESIPKERVESVRKLYLTIKDNLPNGFEERINYGHIGFVVPHSTYPKGYHCDPKSPLPFIGIASQKNFISLYHMGIYADLELYNWFIEEYPKHSKRKLDMGKGCIRLKKMDDIPYDLIKELVSKINPEQWIKLYESNFNPQKE
ncbi:protein of unknown function (DU1801) [Chishuiella changwenlii]|uniref:YdhG-like domain-containing protein n=1 Tax=Chishuiella changwenlii TaxID=1434701 RepID=A0A1M7ANE7_9FLAO|nr:DUF1801 domain-containing protein [Chishuiella changwenlii]GGE90834.1 hypothetical protein GCM10010984_05700 [Chishuiella changwenlii]SHL44185.1 protein of unknown function (DU1801) [Chishuiella changwenlii]